MSRLRQWYNHRALDAKWQARWQESPLVKRKGEKFYCLSMFPYPSGHLHIGHVRVYAIAEAVAKYEHLNGKNVFNPMGWDAFGLPAENAARERGLPPAEWTAQNVAVMKAQMKALGFTFDWDNEIWTCHPDYYKWTQHLFLMLLDNQLVYRAQGQINWDPLDHTVLANEQVDASGRSWRSGALVQQRTMQQWYIRITEFSEELLQGLNTVQWPEQVKELQRGWIGKSEGLTIDFALSCGGLLTVFTTRPETLMGTSFLAVSPEHSILSSLTLPEPEKRRLQGILGKTELERRGGSECFLLGGVCGVHPVSKQEIPVVVAENVLLHYAEGAVMGVPAHDIQDAKVAKVLGLPSFEVIVQDKLVNSGVFSGLAVETARAEITNYIVARGGGRKKTHYKLRDWLVSRQRRWGTPIPLLTCTSCHTVQRAALPCELEATCYKCPQCASPAARDPDTLDTFVDSSWYFLRFLDPLNTAEPFSSEVANQWMPVDLYIGGAEHAIMHLLYARFIHKFLYRLKLVSVSEPFRALLTQGLVLAATYSLNGQYLSKQEADLHPEAKCTFEKMSKSKKNGVDLAELTETYGADALRLAVLFAAPSERTMHWDGNLLKTFHKWLASLCLISPALAAPPPASAVSLSHSITSAFSSRKPHIAIARLMELSRALKSSPSTGVYRSFLTMLYPVAPHLSSELFSQCFSQDVREESWPLFNSIDQI